MRLSDRLKAALIARALSTLDSRSESDDARDVEIPANAEIGYNLERDREKWFVSDNGIVVIPKRANIVVDR